MVSLDYSSATPAIRAVRRQMISSLSHGRQANAPKTISAFHTLEVHMERLKHSFGFWILLVVSVLLPSSALANKQLYQAQIKNGRNPVGSSVITVNTSANYNYLARTINQPGQAVQAVWLTDGSWAVPLCTNGGPSTDDCTYLPDGNLDIEGAITPSMLVAAGVSGGQFNAALTGGTLTIQLANGSILGTGVYIRII
jgi:hypothetical protein